MALVIIGPKKGIGCTYPPNALVECLLVPIGVGIALWQCVLI